MRRRNQTLLTLSATALSHAIQQRVEKPRETGTVQLEFDFGRHSGKSTGLCFYQAPRESELVHVDRSQAIRTACRWRHTYVVIRPNRRVTTAVTAAQVHAELMRCIAESNRRHAKPGVPHAPR